MSELLRMSSWSCRKLKGHIGTVNDVALSMDSSLIASSADDGTVRLWDERSCRAVKCYREIFESFPPEYLQFAAGDASVADIFVTAGNFVYILDSRKDGVIHREPKQRISLPCGDLCSLAACQESSFLVGDDDGTIIFHDINKPDNDFHLSGSHSNLVGSLASWYTPTGQHRLVSGGFDALLVNWDVSGARPLNVLNFTDYCTGSTNPPFVHSMSVTSLDEPNDYVICALGNGELKVVHSDNLTVQGTVEVSGGMLSACQSFNRYVIAAANSGVINGYEIQEKDAVPAEKASTKAAKRRMRRKESTHSKFYDFSQNLCINVHETKINTIKVIQKQSAFSIVVADISNQLSIYDVPM